MRPKAGDCCVFCSYGSVKCAHAREKAKEKKARTLRAGLKPILRRSWRRHTQYTATHHICLVYFLNSIY
ncbi:GDCCVxC domain-containing (seleno)protein [Undibacterium arcticum]